MGRRKGFEGEYYGADAPEVIQKCLECSKLRCNNCIEWMSKADREALREKKRRGEDDGE